MSVQKRMATNEKAMRQVQDKMDELSSHLSQFPFRYSDPGPNFDRSQVKGFVANLVRLKADQLDYANALEVTAGGKLFNVKFIENGIWFPYWQFDRLLLIRKRLQVNCWKGENFNDALPLFL